MKRLWIVASTALTAILLAPVGAQSPTEGIRVWEDINFGGRSSAISRDVSNLSSANMNDQISSLRVAPGETWEVCEHANYKGRCMLVSGNEPDLGRNRFDNLISSVRRKKDEGNSGVGPGFGPSRGVMLFAGTRFTGQNVKVGGAITNLEKQDFNDRANSIQVARGETWQICMDANYGGRCVDVSEDIPDLNAVGMSRLVTSLRQRGTSGSAPGFGGSRPRMILFAETNFRGRSMAIEDSRATLGDFTNFAQSLQIVSGRWEVCDQANYRGSCQTVSSSISNLTSVGLSNRISSVRPR